MSVTTYNRPDRWSYAIVRPLTEFIAHHTNPLIAGRFFLGAYLAVRIGRFVSEGFDLWPDVFFPITALVLAGVQLYAEGRITIDGGDPGQLVLLRWVRPFTGGSFLATLIIHGLAPVVLQNFVALVWLYLIWEPRTYSRVKSPAPAPST